MNLGRRRFLVATGRGVLRLAAAGSAVAILRAAVDRPPEPRPVAVADMGILRPPGALAREADFLQACTRCTLCADACDRACILFFGPEEGRLAGTPYIRAEVRACDLCLLCTQACPSGALQPLEDKAAVRMGVAVGDENLCVSHNGTGACGACHTVCPFRNRAIRQGLRNQPTVDPEVCVGCGMCEEVCIVHERRAIRVRSQRPWT